MNINNVKRSQRRFDTHYYSTMNIQSYGKDNLYPQRMLDLILNSPTGGTCCELYERFIEGDGLTDKFFGDFICNRQGDTVSDILHLVSVDLAHYHGFALHVNYNMMGQIVEVQHMQFEGFRLEEEDDSGRVTFVNYHPDWTGKKTRNGSRIEVSVENLRKFYVFNPNQAVVLGQIESSGGINKYNGQVLWYSMDGRFVYPKPKYDKIVTALSTDDGIDNVKYRNVRNNFLVAGMFIHKKAMSLGIDPTTGQEIKQRGGEDLEFTQNLDIFQGDTNACSIMDITVNSDEDIPKFEKLESQNFDSKFQVTETSTVERIYAAFGQEPFYCIRIGKLGFSGTTINDAFAYYNSYVEKERKEISRVFSKIFDRWATQLNDDNPVCPSDDYSILPVKHISNESTEDNNKNRRD